VGGAAVAPVRSEKRPADISVRGSVRDDKGEGLPGVSIVVKGSQRGTTSDADGTYKIQVPSASAVLIFSFVGYMPQEVAVGSRAMIDVTLQTDDKTLEEIVVVGYGTQKRKDLTGAVGTVDSKEIKEMAVTRIDQALLGKMAGVQVKPVRGEPGAAPQIRAREQAQYFYDGVKNRNIDGGFNVTGPGNTWNFKMGAAALPERESETGLPNVAHATCRR
jgi:hypothetical protein